MTKVKYNFLFNFAVTRIGGGLKRLYEYAKWFHEKGGAWFIIHPNCDFLTKEFPNNKYFIVLQTRVQRVFKDCEYLSAIKDEIGAPDLYYAYGIPVYYKLGKINWFHVSNVLPFNSQGMALSVFDKYVKFKMLGWKINNNYKNADIISAESCTSLSLVKNQKTEKLFLSVNGSDNEIAHLKTGYLLDKDEIAVVVGTQKYKALMDSYYIFKTLKEESRLLKLILIGNKDNLPNVLLGNKDIITTGTLTQANVIEYLKKAKYYISTTLIENSFNAASEGVFFADESYISDIGPHRELLTNESFEKVSIPNVCDSILRVRRTDLVGRNIKPWDHIISELIDKVNEF